MIIFIGLLLFIFFWVGCLVNLNFLEVFIDLVEGIVVVYYGVSEASGVLKLGGIAGIIWV